MDRQERVGACQDKLQIQFHNPALLEQALNHASSCEKVHSNERLEFLGDSVLGLITTEFLYHHFPHYQEGMLTKYKSVLVSRKTLAQITQELGLIEYCSLGNSMSKQQELPQSVLANIFEAILGAIYLDQGYQVAKQFALTHLQKRVLQLEEERWEDYKSQLQDYCQKNFGLTPRYTVLGQEGPEHAKIFTVAVKMEEYLFGEGRGRSKKKAEQEAARVTLQELQAKEIASRDALRQLGRPFGKASLWHLCKKWLTSKKRNRKKPQETS